MYWITCIQWWAHPTWPLLPASAPSHSNPLKFYLTSCLTSCHCAKLPPRKRNHSQPILTVKTRTWNILSKTSVLHLCQFLSSSRTFTQTSTCASVKLRKSVLLSSKDSTSIRMMMSSRKISQQQEIRCLSMAYRVSSNLTSRASSMASTLNISVCLLKAHCSPTFGPTSRSEPIRRRLSTRETQKTVSLWKTVIRGSSKASRVYLSLSFNFWSLSGKSLVSKVKFKACQKKPFSQRSMFWVKGPKCRAFLMNMTHLLTTITK